MSVLAYGYGPLIPIMSDKSLFAAFMTVICSRLMPGMKCRLIPEYYVG